MNKTFIYSLNCPFTNIPKYIGKANNVRLRYNGHIHKSKDANNLKNAWINSLLKNGNKPIVEILDEVNYDEWKFWEMYYISLYKSWGFILKNSTSGGDSTELSIESRIKISNSKKGKQSPRKGFVLSQHTRDLIVANRRSYKGSNNPNFGKHMSEENKEKFKQQYSKQYSIINPQGKLLYLPICENFV